MENYFAVDLPSKGLVYPEGTKVQVRELNGRDEEILASTTVKNYSAKLNELLTNTIQGIDINKLTLGDRQYILLWQVLNSFSEKDSVDIRCESCLQDVEIDIDLSKTNIVNLPDNYSEPAEITLSNKDKIKLRLFRVLDEVENQKMGEQFGAPFGHLYARTIYKDDLNDDRLKTEYYLGLKSKDRAKIRAHQEKYDHGPDFMYEYKCPKCGGSGKVHVPFRIEQLLPMGETLKRYL